MDDQTFDPNELEPGIREIVMLLRGAGFNTTGSCEGGEGHPFKVPTVLVFSRNSFDEEKDLLIEWAKFNQQNIEIKPQHNPGFQGRYLMQIEFPIFNDNKK